MAEDKPTIHIDSDWKKQAQEEKRRLAEQEQQRKPSPPPASGPAAAPAQPGQPQREAPQTPPASFETLVQSLVTQALFYMGELAARGREPVVNLDMAKHNIDTLSMLEEKTANNLTPEEKRMLDQALYEARMRYVSAASQAASYP